MKRVLAILCCGLCLLGLAGCGESETPAPSEGNNATPVAGPRIGLGCVNSVTMDGTDKTDLRVTAVALLLDKDGKVVDCELDELSFAVTLAQGKPSPVTDLATKGEKGDGYIPGEMDTGKVDSLKESWEDQAEAFCDYVEGKMVSDITGLAATDGKSEKIDGCDLLITDFIRAVERAEDAAKTHDMNVTDDLQLAFVSQMATGTTDDKPQYDVELAAVAVDDTGRITGCMTDSLQLKLTVEEGAFTTPSGEMKTKRQAGDGYGMKAASAIKREWYEQADAFDTYVRGKTPAELTQTALNGEGKTDAISGCTMAVSGMIKSVAKAAQKDG